MQDIIERLIADLRSTDTDVYSNPIMAIALGNMGDSRAVQPLCDALHHPSPHVRFGAARALGCFSGHIAVKPLMEAILHDDDLRVRDCALHSLVEIGAPASGLLVRNIVFLARALTEHAIVRALVQIGEPAVESLIDALRHPEDLTEAQSSTYAGATTKETVRVLVAEVLGEIGDIRALTELERVAREDSRVSEELHHKHVDDEARKAAKKIRARHGL